MVESFRLHKGVMDIRGHMNWLDEELASQSTEEMRAMFRRYKMPANGLFRSRAAIGRSGWRWRDGSRYCVCRWIQ